MKVSVVISHNPLMMTIAHDLHHFNIRLHSTSINFYAQCSEVPSLIEDFPNQAAYVSILTCLGLHCSAYGQKSKFWLQVLVERIRFYRQSWCNNFKSLLNSLDNFCFPHNPPTGGTWWRSLLRHCATSWKVTDSIPDCITGIFHWRNPSGSTMPLRLTQPLTEMSTSNISWGVKAAGA